MSERAQGPRLGPRFDQKPTRLFLIELSDLIASQAHLALEGLGDHNSSDLGAASRAGPGRRAGLFVRRISQDSASLSRG